MLDPTKLIIIAVVAFLFFGPDKLPELARTVGRFMREFKRMQEDMETTLRAEMNKVDLSPSAGVDLSPEMQSKPAASTVGHGAGGGWEADTPDEEEEE